MLDKFWHQFLRRPYRLAKTVDTGNGQLVVLLHGIGRSAQVWQHVVTRLTALPYRVVAFDLLGFGASPKPDWPKYDIDDHAKAVIASIDALKPAAPIILVGHSMGCLVAVRAARLRPDLAKHLVLYEMPLYEGLPQKRIYRLRLNAYFRLYEQVIALPVTFNRETAKMVEKMAAKIIGFEAKRGSWLPFVRSLENTIMHQTAADDIKKISVPIDVIYGRFDMLVIRGKPQETFGSDNRLITAHTVRARHVISPRSSQFIVGRIEVAQHPDRLSNTRTRKEIRHAQRLGKTARRTS